ncbi:MAG TPA: DUF5127 domain-containing protein [Streptosporangiaceae bacterium]
MPLPMGRRRFLQAGGIAGAVGATAATIPLASRAAARLSRAARVPRVPGVASPPAPSSALRPPATPLAVRSMYLSTWLPADHLPGTWPAFWNGHVTAITGLARVDGVTYVWCGDPLGLTRLAEQVAREVTATGSVYTLRAGPVLITAGFLSPVDPLSLRRQSVPMSYVTARAVATDGGRHQVQLYLDISAEWAHGNLNQPVAWEQQVTGGLNVITVTPSPPGVLQEYRDQASWGTVVWATDDVPGLSWQTGQDVVVRAGATRGVLAGTNDTRQPRAISDDWPVFGFLRDLGQVTSEPSAVMVACLGHVRQPAVSYLGRDLPPYWTTFWRSWPEMLAWFRQDLDAARAVSTETDAAVRRWAGAHPGIGSAGDQYAAITALALRQAFGGTELVAGPGGVPWAFLKEISSSGNVSTVDVLFPSAPAYLQLSPAYLRMLLDPVFDLASRDDTAAWAPHDLGAHYPAAAGVPGPDGTQMPIEESGNMLLMTAAVLSRMTAPEAAAYAGANYPLLRRWAGYLLAQEPDYPGPQSQTDDFTGAITESVNLNLKGILGVAAFSQIAGHAGQAGDQASAASAARRFIGRWASLSQDAPAHRLELSYGAPGSFSLDYNAYPDRLLNLNLVSPALQAEQGAAYLAVAGPYGVPLDSRHSYTKADWEMLTAAFLYTQPAARNMLISRLYSFLDASPSRVPFTDWYDADAGTQTGFQGRPVVGATFALDTLRATPGGPNGLTAYWPLNAGHTRDVTAGLSDLTLAGGATCPAGGARGVLSLNGVAAHASAARPVVRTDHSFTVTAQVRLDRRSGWPTAVSQDGRAAPGFALQYDGAADRWAFAMTIDDSAVSRTVRARSRTAPVTGSWAQLGAVYDAAAGQLRLYLDGVLQDTVLFRARWHASGRLQLGRGLRSGRAADFFPGAIRAVRTYGRALTTAELASLAGLDRGLLASYAMAEGHGLAVADQAGHHPLRLRGATWGDGFTGSGLSFGGSPAQAGTAAFVPAAGDFSVSAWLLLSGTDGRRWQLAVSQDGDPVGGFFLGYSAADDAWAFGRWPARAAALLPPRTGDWQHLVGVHDRGAGEFRLYVDGRLAGTAAAVPAVPGGPAHAARGAFVLGRGQAGRPAHWFRGGIDQVRVWGRPLSGTDVSVLV